MRKVTLWDFFEDAIRSKADKIRELNREYLLDPATNLSASLWGMTPEEVQQSADRIEPYLGIGPGVISKGIPAGLKLNHATQRPWQGGYKAKFDVTKLRSGEGGTMYNPGLYTSENPKVTQSYLDSLSTTEGMFRTPQGAFLDRWDFRDKLFTEISDALKNRLGRDNVDIATIDDIGTSISRGIEGLIKNKRKLSPNLPKEIASQHLVDALHSTSGNYSANAIRTALEDTVKSTLARYEGTSFNRDSTMMEFLLKDKYRPKILDLEKQLYDQTPDVRRSIWELDKQIRSRSPEVAPLNVDKIDEWVQAEKAWWANQKNSPMGKYVGRGEVPLESNPYWSTSYNPATDTMRLNARGAHYYDPAAHTDRPLLWDMFKGDEAADLLKRVDTSQPPSLAHASIPRADMYGRELPFTGMDLQHYLNNLYHRGGQTLDRDPNLLASSALNKVGVQGNRYLDEGSRNLPWDSGVNPTKNYVLWGDEVLNDLPILRIRSIFDY